jgi:hypothetical protein
MRFLKHLLFSIFALGFSIQSSLAIADKDSDGMSDIWELSHGFSASGNSNPNQAATADPDGDGATNLQEAIAGTAPFIGSQPLGAHKVKITRHLSIDGSFNLQWNQLLGKQYTIFKSTTIASTSWTQDGIPLIGNGAQTLVVTQPQSGTERAFWRVQVADIDPDLDTLSSWEEGIIGTNPTNSDSDFDEISDGYEYKWGGLSGLNPGDNLDSDSLNNLAEFQAGTDPTNADSDNDQTYDDTEIEQETSPADASDLGKVVNGKIRIRVGTGTFLGPSYPFPAYPVYPINIYRRNMTTGVETLLHSVPTLDFFVAQNIDLPNDGSVYSLQVEMPFYGSEFGLPFRDFRWICSCFARPGSAPVAILDNFDTTTNSFGVAGRLLGNPPQAYAYAFRQFRALIVPVNVDYVSRDPQTGVHTRVNAIVEGSDVRPDVKIVSTSATINSNNQLSVTFSGTARDTMSETLASGLGAVSSLQLYLNGEVIETLTNLTPVSGGVPVLAPWLLRDSTVSFTKTVLIDDIAPGMHTLRLFSNANALGKKGFDGVSILVEKQNYNPVTIANPPNFVINLPPSFSTGVDTITIQNGSDSAVLTEDNAAPNSGLFTGMLMINGSQREIGVQIPQTYTPSPSTEGTFVADISWRAGTQNQRINGSWNESSVSSEIFNPIALSISTRSNSTGNLVITSIRNDQNVVTQELSPTALRVEVPDNFDFFGASGLLTAELNGSPATFHEAPSAIPYMPPTGKKWFYLGSAGQPQIFVLNPSLSGTSQAPAAILSANRFDLTMKLRRNNTVAFQDSSTIRAPYEFKEIVGLPAPLLQSTNLSSFSSSNLSSSSLTLPAYTMQDVRFWFGFLFDEAGENLLAGYENGFNDDDGLIISLQTFWPRDGDAYRLEYVHPHYNSTNPSVRRAPELFLNRRKLATPIDASIAIFAAIQEIRGLNSYDRRNGLTVSWIDILEAYVNSDTYDPNIDEALRTAKLGPIKDSLLAGKSAIELGLSISYVGDLIVSANDFEEQLQQGNIKGAAVVGVLFFTPEIVDRLGGYCIKKGKKFILDFGPTGQFEATARQIKEIGASGVLNNTLGANLGRAQKRELQMEGVLDLVQRNVIGREEVEMLYKSGILHLDPKKSRVQLRKNLNAANFDGKGKAAHHWLCLSQKSQELEKEFIIRGVDPNLAENGEFMDFQKHVILHGRGSTGWIDGDPLVHQWVLFFRRNTESNSNRAAILNFRDQLKAVTSGDITSVDSIAWPFAKTERP